MNPEKNKRLGNVALFGLISAPLLGFTWFVLSFVYAVGSFLGAARFAFFNSTAGDNTIEFLINATGIAAAISIVLGLVCSAVYLKKNYIKGDNSDKWWTIFIMCSICLAIICALYVFIRFSRAT